MHLILPITLSTVLSGCLEVEANSNKVNQRALLAERLRLSEPHTSPSRKVEYARPAFGYLPTPVAIAQK